MSVSKYHIDMETDPTTKALQDIAAQLRRIADCMEQHPQQNITIHVNEGATISGGITDIAEYIVNRPGIANAGTAIKNLTSAVQSAHNTPGK